MTVSGVIAGAAVVLAIASWVVARRSSRRAAQLQDMYWALKFEHTELKARLDRVAPEAGAAPRVSPGAQFVPLSDVKR
jgi:hypothetical protein